MPRREGSGRRPGHAAAPARWAAGLTAVASTGLCMGLTACSDDGSADAGVEVVGTVEQTVAPTMPVPTAVVPTTEPTTEPAARSTTGPPTEQSNEPSNEPPTSVASTEPSTTVAPTSAAPTLPPPAPPPPVDQLRGVGVRWEPVADLAEPTGLAWRAGDSGLYVSVQGGRVHRLDAGRVDLVLDLSDETTIVEPGSERGLLGIAFDPRDGRMFLDFTGRDNHTRVVSFEVADGVAVRESRRDILFVEQPGVGHNGGRLVFDPAGHLFIGMGDGGGSNGRDAQDPTKLLGAILRVLPRLDGPGYDIPPDNPFVAGGDRPEVWVRGLRNPWMFSLDRATGNLWIGDVGNTEREEVDLVPAGQSGLNFGWYWFEGTKQRYGSVPAGLTPPVLDYPHSEGVAVMGGYVYRGSAVPALAGAYVFGDLTGPVWALGADGRVRLDLEPVRAMTGWGEDASGELYVFSLYDGVFRLVPA